MLRIPSLLGKQEKAPTCPTNLLGLTAKTGLENYNTKNEGRSLYFYVRVEFVFLDSARGGINTTCYTVCSVVTLASFLSECV